jgi:hypothetical protein
MELSRERWFPPGKSVRPTEPRRHPESPGLFLQLAHQELILAAGPPDGGSGGCSQSPRRSDVVDVPMGQQDVAQLHSSLPHGRLEPTRFTSRIDDHPGAGLGAPDQAAVLRQGRDA